MQHKIIRFGLIRHAQTIWNREKKIQGHSDSPLTADGERQASSWGQILLRYSWDRILASDAGRALTTGERINAFLKIPGTTQPVLRPGAKDLENDEQYKTSPFLSILLKVTGRLSS